MKAGDGTGAGPTLRKGDRMLSKLVGRLAFVTTIFIFCVAVIALFREFESVNSHDVLARLAALPKRQFFAAIGLTTASYLLLTGYDFLALRYIRRHLRFLDVLYASFTAFAFSNNIGFQLLSGGSMRYRIYSGLGLHPVEIGEIVAFCTFTYALGIITVGGLVAVLDPADVASVLRLSKSLTFAFGIVLLASSVTFLMVAGVWRKPIALGRYTLRPPSLTLALAQVMLASIDAVLAGTVIYVLLPPDIGITFQSFLGVYLTAATAGVLSLVPGGLGVFETVVTVMTAPQSKAALLGAFITYRMIYFIAPFIIAILCFAVAEIRRRALPIDVRGSGQAP